NQMVILMRKHYSLFTLLFSFLFVFATCSQESKSMKLYEVYKADPHPQSSSSSYRSTPMMGVSPWHQDQKRQRTDKTSRVDPVRPEEKLLYSTVRIERGGSIGTGFLIKKDTTTFLVTNMHVVKPDPEKASSAREKNIRIAIRRASFSLYFHY